MNWIDAAKKVLEKDNTKIQLAPLSNIVGVDIHFNKGYGTIKINVPAKIADDLTNGSKKYVGGFLIMDRVSYEAVCLEERDNK